MKSMRKLGVCLAVALVLGAVSASGATAAPGWYECAKAAVKGSGSWEKGCTKDTVGSKTFNDYEIVPGVGKGKVFKGKLAKRTAAVLHVKANQGDNTVTCEKAAESGHAALPNLETEVMLTLTKCKLSIASKVCASSGAAAGEIKVPALRGELGYLNESPTEVGVRLESEAHPGGAIVEFSCEGLAVTVNGEVIAQVSGNVNTFSKTFKTTYLAGEYLGEVEFEGNKFTPLVNQLGFADELEEIANKEKAPTILKSVICGSLIEVILKKPCTPEAPTGLDAEAEQKGEALEIKA